jgi:hypothetical protein
MNGKYTTRFNFNCYYHIKIEKNREVERRYRKIKKNENGL